MTSKFKLLTFIVELSAKPQGSEVLLQEAKLMIPTTKTRINKILFMRDFLNYLVQNIK